MWDMNKFACRQVIKTSSNKITYNFSSILLDIYYKSHLTVSDFKTQGK